MSIENWGNLPKSQIDNETIESAIKRLIQAHCNDVNAHLEEGQSLYSHKASEIIDHLAFSIVSDKIQQGAIKFYQVEDNLRVKYSPPLESIDGWDSNGVNLTLGGFSMYQGNLQNVLYYAMTSGIIPLNWEKNFTFSFLCKIGDTTNCIAYALAGDVIYDSEDQGIGFKFINNKVYATHVSMVNDVSQEFLTEINVQNKNSLNLYRVEFIVGQRIEFYVNDLLLATHTTNFPSQYYCHGIIFCFNIKNIKVGYGAMYEVGQLYFAQDK